MDEIEAYIEEHAREDIPVHLMVDHTEEGWRARLLGGKGYELLDRTGDLYMIGRGDTIQEALDELEELASIRQ